MTKKQYIEKKLGEVCKIVNGGTPDTKVARFWGGDQLWITPKDMGKLDNMFVVDTARKITEEGLKNTSVKILPVNSIILSSRAPIGHLAINKKAITTNQGCKGIIPNSEISTMFLFYFLKNSVELLNDLGSGTTFKEISSSKLAGIKIPYPSLPEQRRIVSILDKVFAAIAKAKANAEKNLANSRELFESYLLSMFANPGDGWEEKKLDEVCVVERGSSPRPIKKYITTDTNGVNWIKIGDTKNSTKYLFETKDKITREGSEKSRYVTIGDFILSNSMSFGRPYIMKTDGYIHDGWFVLRLNDNIEPNYFHYLLTSTLVQSQFKHLSSGAIVKNISGDLVKKTILPIPPLPEQHRIVSKLDALSTETKKLEAVYRKKLADLDELKKALLQKAFQGEL